jgi:hypothetical protein
VLDLRAEHQGGTTPMGAVALAPPRRLAAQVERAAGQTLEWIANGRVVARHLVGAAPNVLETPPPARWYAAVLRDDIGPTAFSNAIYVGGH